MSEVTRLLSALEHGQPHAAEELLPLVYDELRKLAAKLVSESQDRLSKRRLWYTRPIFAWSTSRVSNWDSRRHFFAAAAEAMRRILDRTSAAASQRQDTAADSHEST